VNRARGLLAAGLVLATFAGCGDSASSDPEPKPRPPETADEPPDLPDGWKPYVNRAGGFVLGLPPGWKPKEIGASTLIRSYDELVSIQVTPDRTDEAIRYDPEKFATRAIAALPGYEEPLKPGKPEPYRGHYDGATVSAHGVAKATGVEQDVELTFLVNPKVAAFTAVVAANATAPQAEASRRLADDVVASIRSRPPG
jgi:hypothetical protein